MTWTVYCSDLPKKRKIVLGMWVLVKINYVKQLRKQKHMPSAWNHGEERLKGLAVQKNEYRVRIHLFHLQPQPFPKKTYPTWR